MGLEIRHNRASHTHENEQFRRIAASLQILFKEKQWDGLLIGNPENKNFNRFRADAILLYNFGLVIIDLKDYSGVIKLPPNENEFNTTRWYCESELDKRRIEIKAGTRFINPFLQLKYYRREMYEIIHSNIILNGNLQPSRTCALNIFSGPIEIVNRIPGNLPYYKIVQEEDFATFLYDYASENSFSNESADVLKQIFPAEVWEEKSKTHSSSIEPQRIIEIDGDIKAAIDVFLESDKHGVLLLESMHVSQRDLWMQYILSNSVEFEIPQTEVWTHSARIGRKILQRTGIEVQSLYNTIYGGKLRHTIDERLVGEESSDDSFGESKELKEVVPIRSDETLDKSALIILHEAHLVNRSLHQSELLRFGSGRLLQDLLSHLNLDENSRKLICIGDPFSLSYGKVDDNALSFQTIMEMYDGEITHFRQKLNHSASKGIARIRNDLAQSIDNKTFNSIKYFWDSTDLKEIERKESGLKLNNWFGNISDFEPRNGVLVFSNKDARTINKWIKANCLNNEKGLAKGDLLIVNNNINIPDDTGFGLPQKLYNGMYLMIREVRETIEKSIKIKQAITPIILSYTKLKVTCLSHPQKLSAEIWMLRNYFENDDLSKNEEIALKVFIGEKIRELLVQPFIESWEYTLLVSDNKFKNLSEEDRITVQELAKGESVKTTRAIRNLVSKYKKLREQKAMMQLIADDPLINAVYVSYGWCITVHKAVGSTFSNVLFKANRGENQGLTNDDHFRWLYSAISTVEKVVYVANPQEISPFMDCRFEDVDEVITTEQNTKMFYEEYIVPYSFADIIDNEYIPSVKGAISELSKLLEQHGLILESCNKFGDYLTKVQYSIPESTEKFLIIAINNSKQRMVTSARIEKSNEVDQEIVRECIAILFKNASYEQNAPGLEFPTDFRESIYKHWSVILKNHGYKLKLIESHTFQDVFKVFSPYNYTKFGLHYNGKGLLTLMKVLETTDLETGSNLKSWLLDEN